MIRDECEKPKQNLTKICQPPQNPNFLMSYLQAFGEGNKRMGRLLSNEPLLRTGIPPLSFIGILATLAEFERDLIRERTMAGLTAARARGRKGGRKVALTKAQVRLAQAAIGIDDVTADPVEKDIDQVWACGQDFVP
jgi:DNA invertase Pin-like site-specific DNA recombinase